MSPTIAPATKAFELEIHAAPAQPLVVVPPARKAVSSLDLLATAEKLDGVMYRAVRGRGSYTHETPFQKISQHPSLIAVTTLAGGIASGCTFGWVEPWPFFGGLIAGLAASFAQFAFVTPKLEQRWRHDVLEPSAAQQMVSAFEQGDQATQRMLVRLAARWSSIVKAREVAGAEAREQLKALADVAVPLDSASETRVATVLAILESLTTETGVPRSELDDRALSRLRQNVERLDGADRTELATYLRDRLFRKERPRFKTNSLRETNELYGALTRGAESIASTQRLSGLVARAPDSARDREGC